MTRFTRDDILDLAAKKLRADLAFHKALDASQKAGDLDRSDLDLIDGLLARSQLVEVSMRAICAKPGKARAVETRGPGEVVQISGFRRRG